MEAAECGGAVCVRHRRRSRATRPGRAEPTPQRCDGIRKHV